ncbi:MAG: FKBP-type peptidyl-prolyl cis-trans isomerase [Bacteroidales bacterium]
MKTNYFFPFLVLLLAVFTTSCLTTTDPAETYAAWKAQNESYFTNMKDSAGFVLVEVPANRGGGSYYSKIFTAGTGTSPLYTDSVIVHYQGRLIDWKLFDATYSGSTPDWYKNENTRTFKVKDVVRGWTEVLMQMKAGEKRRVVIPWNLAYGANGTSGISPYSTLIFDIQLVSFGSPKSN